MHVALIGLGRIGKVHFHNLISRHDVIVKYVIDLDTTVSEQFLANEYSHVTTKVLAIENIATALNDNDIHAVFICTPVQTHKSTIMQALDHDKAVFCEKPLAQSVQDVMECYRKAEEKKLPLYCGLQRRFDPQLRHLRDKVQSGHVGKVRTVRSVGRDPVITGTTTLSAYPGDLIAEAGIHDIDVICWYTGECPSSIYATAHAQTQQHLKKSDYDVVRIILNFPSGTIGEVDIVRDCPSGYDQRLEVVGTKLVMTSENRRELEVTKHGANGVVTQLPERFFQERYREAYKLEVEHVLKVIKGQTAMEVTGDDVKRNTIIVHAAIESAKSNQVVELSEFQKQLELSSLNNL